MLSVDQIQKRRFARPILVLGGVLLLILSFSSGYFVGGNRSVQKNVPVGEPIVVGQGSKPTFTNETIDFKTFWDVWNYAKETFYKQPVSDKDLYYGALKGLLAGLKDPYSVYFDPEEAKQFNSDLNGTFVGIGAQIGIKDEKLQVIAPLENSPAERAGLRPGDWIASIDGKDTGGMSVEQAVSLIRGAEGTPVVLLISRDGLKDLKEIKIVREKIKVDSVKWKIDEHQFMTITIGEFNSDTSGLFNQAVQEALTKNVKGLIIDLRSNPGGLLTSAIDIASTWVGYDPVVIEQERPKAITYNGVAAPRLASLPTVVLVDGGSASASEILAGALQDYGLAKLVGTKTFGKGSVQDYRELSDGSALKITIAEWYTPKGRSINKTGIEPDVSVEFDPEQYKKGYDTQKQTAINILLGTYKETVKPVETKK